MKKIGLADDHNLVREGLSNLVEKFGYSVILEAENGQDLIDKIKAGKEPDLVLMDIKMPVKDGYEATQWLKEHYPDINVLALTMIDDGAAIYRMLKCGAKGYLLKEADPTELKIAIDSIFKHGRYYSDLVTGKLVHSISEDDTEIKNLHHLNDRELEFLKLVCTEMTYKEIASQMHLSPRTIDGYRDALLEKLDLKGRTGLVVYAIKNGIVNV